MNFIFEPLKKLQGYNTIYQKISNGLGPIAVTGPADSQKAHFAAALLEQSGRRGLFVAFNEMQAHRMLSDFRMFFGENALLFPSREIVFFDVTAKSHDNDRQRMHTLDRIVGGEFKVVVASIEAIALKTFGPEHFVGSSIVLKDAEQADLRAIAKRLTDAGYERTDSVDSVGHFAIRGGILDVFPAGNDFAVRIEFFDDIIDTIRTFDVETQRSIEKLNEVRIIPTAESDQVARGCVLDYLKDSLIFVDEPARMHQRLENLLLEYDEDCRNMLEKGRLAKGFEQHYFRYLDNRLFAPNTAVFSVLGAQSDVEQTKLTVSLACGGLSGLGGLGSGLFWGPGLENTPDPQNGPQAGPQTSVILAGQRSRAKRVAEHYMEQGLNYPFVKARQK